MEEWEKQLPSFIPDYVVDEVRYYFKKIASGKLDVFTLDNAIFLVNLAIVKGRVTSEQGDIIKGKIRSIKK